MGVARDFLSQCGACGPNDDSTKITTEDYVEVFRDDFDGNGAVDAGKWEHVHSGGGFGNHEKQFYTNREDNSFVSDGTLKIKALREHYGGAGYTSAKLQTRADFLYGKGSIRARLPEGQATGTWAALWMMPRNSDYGTWPQSGEIDIMEHVGYDSGKVHGTVHAGCCYHSIGTQVGGSTHADVGDWHIYQMEWNPEIVKFALDGSVYQTYVKTSDDPVQWPFNKPFYVIMNMAVGGDWGGLKGIDKDAFRGDGKTMEIDWVSVEQKEWPIPVPACCGGCGGGKNFCSPRSGTCYRTKAKDYYAECPASEPVPSPAPGLIETDGAVNSSCCGGCSGGKNFCSPRSGKCYQTQAKEYYAECPASEPVASPAPAPNIVDEVASPKDAPTCDDQWNNLACSGQFGHEECHTCGARIEFLKTARGGRKTDAQAKASVAKDFISQCGACGPNDDSTKITTEGYTEVFRDDFEGEGAVDTEKWEHVHSGGGFGNNERQFYTNREKNSFVSNGTLKIRAFREHYGGESYTSAKLQSRADYLYGKVSIRARLPRGQATGTWAALWMMPRTSEYGGWPKSGEIDIMEHVGYDSGKLHGTVHAGCCYHSIGTQVGGSTRADAGEWHTYQMEWNPELVKFALDGNVYQTYAKTSDDPMQWPFNKPFYVIMNMAVGGDWGGQKGIDKDAFRGDGQTMEIDWVSVEQKEWPTPVPACCGGCGGGKNFCSPRSGSCYASKSKNYYAECPALEPVA